MDRVRALTIHRCSAGWRNYHFLKIETADGIVGWSEFGAGNSTPAIAALVDALAPHVIGQALFTQEHLHARLSALTRASQGSIAGQALGAIENAFLDAMAKSLGVPCYSLLGGLVSSELPVYWSHFANWRVNHPDLYGRRIERISDVRAAAEEVRAGHFSALKTNVFRYDGDIPRTWQPGFGRPFSPALVTDPRVFRDLRRHLDAIRDGAGPDVAILLDLNFNVTAAGSLEFARAFEEYDLFWMEVDGLSPPQLAQLRGLARQPVASCETLIGLESFLPYFQAQAVDVAIIDVAWNGAWQSVKIAAGAAAFKVNVAPHDFYGHLGTMMNAHFSAAIPNLQIVEVGIDRPVWDRELVTHAPDIVDGHLKLSDRPGWGTDPIEEAMKRYPAI